MCIMGSKIANQRYSGVEMESSWVSTTGKVKGAGKETKTGGGFMSPYGGPKYKSSILTVYCELLELGFF